VTVRARLITAAVAGALLLLAGFSGVAHASVCSLRAVHHLRWTRSPGARAGVLHWRAPHKLPAEAGYRVWRSGALVGVARRRHAGIRVTPRQTYTFTVRVENLVTGHVSACSASLKRTISYYPPGKARKLVASHVTSSTVRLAWRAAVRGDGRLAGYRVYRNTEVLGQIESTRMTARHLFSGQEYSFYVRAVDTNGIQGPRSRIVTIRTPAPEKTTGNSTGFILESDGESFADLQRHYLHVGTILPTYFNCTPSGTSKGVDDPLVTSWALRRGLVVEPRFNCQNEAAIKAILTNSAVQQHIISQLVNLTLKYGYQGINIDFESNDLSAYRNQLTNFATHFATALHAHGKKLSMEVSAAYYNQLVGRAGFYDYKALAAVADEIYVMVWGKSWAVSPPGGLDPMPWFQSVLAYVDTMPLKSKFSIIMTFYGFDWPSGGGPSHPGTPIEWRSTRALIQKYHVTPAVDPTADDPHFSYTDSAGIHHDVWYSNRRTIADRVALARRLGLGVGFWRLGREDPDIWGTRLIGGG
jgi:spore germination protein YaaH